MIDFDAQIIAITGATRGIGAATAKVLADAGATVYICGRSAADLQDLAASSASIIGTVVDVQDEDAVEAWIEAIGSEQGRLDVLINNAGVLGPKCPLDQTTVAAFRKTLDINVVGAFATTRAAYPWLRKAPRPVVINLSSSVGRQGRANWGAYSISKFAVEGLTEVTADELGEYGACVVSLNPGGTATAMRAKAYPEEDPQSLPSTNDVAATIALLIAGLSPAQNDAKFASRDLFEPAQRFLTQKKLPEGLVLSTIHDGE